ncbi:MAG: type II secretion system protein [Candidatus Paceibacterota bacterium]|jgi:prepilin-type N-terminal cleavage/methylation domain-containing protein
MGEKDKKIQRNRGMTYVELIVVLSIFSVLSSVAIFNYSGFQARVDIKNLASDIAIKVVEAQKSALAGVLPPSGFNFIPTWKPSYGVYFDITTQSQFVYFVDLNNFNGYEPSNNETLDTISITKNNTISSLEACYAVPCVPTSLNNLAIYFSRPNSGAVINTTPVVPAPSYVQITARSPQGAYSLIKLYPSGRVEVK